MAKNTFLEKKYGKKILSQYLKQFKKLKKLKAIFKKFKKLKAIFKKLKKNKCRKGRYSYLSEKDINIINYIK